MGGGPRPAPTLLCARCLREALQSAWWGMVSLSLKPKLNKAACHKGLAVGGNCYIISFVVLCRLITRYWNNVDAAEAEHIQPLPLIALPKPYPLPPDRLFNFFFCVPSWFSQMPCHILDWSAKLCRHNGDRHNAYSLNRLPKNEPGTTSHG